MAPPHIPRVGEFRGRTAKIAMSHRRNLTRCERGMRGPSRSYLPLLRTQAGTRTGREGRIAPTSAAADAVTKR